MNIIYLIISALIGYVIGSFSTGLMIAERKKIAIRELGSKSTGATNVLRVIGIKYGLLTFLGDAMKGVMTILLTRLLFGNTYAYIAALFTVIGHNWPIYYGFKGGKGVAVSCAVIVMIMPDIAIISIVITLLVIYFTKYVSVGSLTLISSAFILSFFYSKPLMESLLMLVLLLLATYRHRANIQRLIEGKENKIGFGKRDKK